MADPLSVGASSLTVITACVQTTSSLLALVKRYRGRDRTLGRLQDGLQDLLTFLQALEKVGADDSITRSLIDGPVARCSQICHDFEAAMQKFSSKSRLGLVDWARMEFMAGDISDFMDTIASYKSTIAVGLGVINMSV